MATDPATRPATPLRQRGLVLAIGFATACAHDAPSSPTTAPPTTAPPTTARPTTVSTDTKHDALFAWPVPRFTAAQLAEVKTCAAKKRAVHLYPETVDLGALSATTALDSACDEATLAAACARRLGTSEFSQACLDAYARAITANPAFAFADGLVAHYAGKLALVAPPPAARHAVVGLALDYKWSGTGPVRAWHVDITSATTNPHVTVTGATAKRDVDVRAEVAAFGSALERFLPIAEPIQANHCTGDNPEWRATLHFEGGDTLELANHRSNLIAIGGPFQMTIGGVTYLQLGTQLTMAVGALVEALGLPRGVPADTTCTHYDFESAVLK